MVSAANRADQLGELEMLLQEARAVVARLENKVAAIRSEGSAEHPIVVWRTTRALTQSALAKKAGISAPALSKIERSPGFKARAGTRQKLAAALNVPEAWLYAPDLP
jgi:DNA-binding XRE family transcriptional regulator